MITSQIDQVVDRLPNGLIPSNINPSHKFWRFTINSNHVQLMWTHALESITCQTNPSWDLLPWNHFYNLNFFGTLNILLNPRINGKCLNTFFGTLLFLATHEDWPQTRHFCCTISRLWNKTHPWSHASIALHGLRFWIWFLAS
jgi:hypothetical protein